jgi:hypothetical protein
MDCPGPYCSEINLATEFIRDLSNIDKIKPLIKNKIKLKKGIIFELKLYLSIGDIVKILCKLNPRLTTVNQSTLSSKVYRLFKIKKKLSTRKKVKGISSFAALCQQTFEPPKIKNSRSTLLA